MRKSTKLMAGLGVVAGLGVALAPLATFADPVDAGADHLTITVNSDCVLTKDGTTGADIEINGHYSKTGNPGQLLTLDGPASGEFAVATFECSENSKVDMYAQAANLTSTTTTDVIEAANIKASYTGANGMDIVDTWEDTYGALSSTNTKVGEGVAVAGGKTTNKMTFTINGYQVQLNNDQEPGVYEGDVTYTYVLINQ